MDETLSKAVRKNFVDLYNKGLIYRGFRISNFCPKCATALSDAEVEYKEKDGSFWHLRYPVKDSDEYVIVATTRPETMLGDTAVAVHPEDERYAHLVGKTLILPLVGREIPVVADEYVEKDFGTGCVKITPCHDPNDFEVGKRHDVFTLSISLIRLYSVILYEPLYYVKSNAYPSLVVIVYPSSVLIVSSCNGLIILKSIPINLDLYVFITDSRTPSIVIVPSRTAFSVS